MGKRRLEAAMNDTSPNLNFDVRWRPFQLNPSLPTGEGYNKLQYYKDRFGAQRVEGMIASMKEVGEEHGISFSYGGSVGNSFNSHRLIWKAREEGGSELQDIMVNEIFHAYFEEEKSLGVNTVLEDCARKAGMDSSIISQVLSNESLGKDEVEREMIEFGRKWNCRGVPLFIVDGKYPLSGAQPPSMFLEVFDEIVSSTR